MKPKPTFTTLPFKIGISPTLKIRAVIANRKIKKSEVIEACPIILVDRKEEAALRQTVLWKYYYEWNRNFHAIILGYGSLINHSYVPNTRYIHNYRLKLLIYKAIKDIKKGEEICVNYNYYPRSKAQLDAHLLDYNKHKPG